MPPSALIDPIIIIIIHHHNQANTMDYLASLIKANYYANNANRGRPLQSLVVKAGTSIRLNFIHSSNSSKRPLSVDPTLLKRLCRDTSPMPRSLTPPPSRLSPPPPSNITSNILTSAKIPTLLKAAVAPTYSNTTVNNSSLNSFSSSDDELPAFQSSSFLREHTIFATDLDGNSVPQSTTKIAKSLPKTSDNRSYIRYLPTDLVKLDIGDKIIIVIPPNDDKTESSDLISTRDSFKKYLFSAMASGFDVPTKSKSSVLQDTLDEKHSICRGNRTFYEIPAVVVKYPCRSDFMSLPLGYKEMINHLFKKGSGVGIRLDNYQNNRPLDIKWNEMHSIEIWGIAQRYRENNQLEFWSTKRALESLADELGLQMSMVDGDVQQTTELMHKFYRAKSDMLQDKLKRATKKIDSTKLSSPVPTTAADNDLHQLKAELTYKKMEAFCTTCDAKFANQIVHHYGGFHSIGESLMREQQWDDMSGLFQSEFPLHYGAMENICFSARDERNKSKDGYRSRVVMKQKIIIN